MDKLAPIGPELDAIVAGFIEPKPAHVAAAFMVLAVQFKGHPFMSESRAWVCLCDYENGQGPAWTPRKFSWDWAAAGLALNHLAGLGIVVLGTGDDGLWSCDFMPTQKEEFSYIYKPEETGPLAISRAIEQLARLRERGTR